MISCEYYKIFKNNFYYRTPLGTASVLRTIRILNFNRFLENMRTMDDLNFANFLSDRVMGGASYCCASYCCFHKFAFGNLLSQNRCFCLQPPLRKVPLIASFAKLFQTTSSRMSYRQILLVLMPICFNISSLLTFC